MAERILVIGGPGTGKTFFANKLSAETGIPVKRTDDLIGQFAWDDASSEVAKWFDLPGPWIIEGTTTVRALRKWLMAHTEGLPADQIVLGGTVRKILNTRQVGMAKAHFTIWNQIRTDLMRRGLTPVWMHTFKLDTREPDARSQ